jgi:hypothetical protein
MVSVSQSVSQLPRSYSYRIHKVVKPRRARRLRRRRAQAQHARPAAPAGLLVLLAWALAALGVSRLPATCL